MATKNFIVTWPDLKASVECGPRENDINLWIYTWWLEQMPFRYLQLHAALTGGVLYTWMRVPKTLPTIGSNTLTKVRMPTVQPGMGHFSYNIPNGLAGGRMGHVALIYGPMYEDMDSYYAFRVLDKDIPTLKEVGARVWQAVYKTKQIITAEFRVKQ